MAVADFKLVANDVDLSGSAGVLQTISDLSFDVLAGETVFFEYTLHWDAGANIGMRVGINGPAGNMRVGVIQSNSTTTADFSSTATKDTAIFAATAGSNAPDGFAVISGSIVCTANGTITLKVANEGSGVITLYANSSAKFESANRYELSFSETLNNWLDAVTLRHVQQHADNLAAWADENVRWLSYQLTFADTEAANWADQHNLLISSVMARADSMFFAADAFAYQLIIPLAFSESIANWSDALQMGGAFQLRDSFAYNLGDNSALTLNLSDSFTLSDSVQLRLGQRLVFSESLTVPTDSFKKIVYDTDLPDFPIPGVLDDFNRADAGTLGANWLTPITQLADRNEIVSNKAAADSGGNSSEDYYVSTFGPDVDVYLTLSTFATFGDVVRLFARIANPNTGSVDAYCIEAQRDTIPFVIIKRFDNGFLSLLTENILLPAITSGDSIGLRIRGTTLTAYYKVGAGSWVAVGQANDSTYSAAGYAGFQSTGSNIRIDDFGAGTLGVAALTLSVSDSLNNWGDSLQIGYGLIVSDSFTLTDSCTVVLGYSFNFSDALTLSDSYAQTLGQNFNFSDSFTLTDAFAQVLGQLLTFSDSFTLNDAYVQVLGLQVSFSDSFTLSDAYAQVLGLLLSFSDTLTLADSETQILGIQFSLSDSANNLTDSIAIGYGLLCVDNADNLADSSAQRANGLVSLSDTLPALTDSETQILGILLSLSDSANNFTDSITIGYGLFFTDSTNNLTDALAIGYGLSFADSSNNLADSYSQQSTGSASFSDSFVLTDSVNLRLEYRLNFSDSINLLADNCVVTPSQVVSFSDSLNNWDDSYAQTEQQLLDLYEFDDVTLYSDGDIDLSDDSDVVISGGGFISHFNDSLAIRLEKRLALSDDANALTDSIAIGYGLLLTDDANNLTDSFAYNRTDEVLELTLSFSDALIQTDSLSIGYGLLISDAGTQLDSLEYSVGQPLEFSDSIQNWADSLDTILGYLLEFADSIDFLLDSPREIEEYRLNLTDSFTLTDSYNLETLSNGAFSDTIVLSDSIELLLAGFIEFSDSFTLTDSYEQTLELQLSLEDDAQNLADNCAVSLQHLISIADSVFVWQDALQLDYGLIISDQFSLTDSETHVLGYSLEFADDIYNLLDSASYELGQKFSFSDSLSASDSIAIGYGLLTNDQFLLTDSIELVYQLSLSLDDAISLTDSLEMNLGQCLSLSDSFSLTDSAYIELGLLLSFADNGNNLDDSYTSQLIGVYTSLLSDSLNNWNDSIDLRLEQLLSLSDDLNSFSDSIALCLDYLLLLSDDLNNWSDSFASTAPQPAGLQLGLADSIAFWQDSLTASLVHLFNFSETYVQSDSVSLGYGLLITETVNNLADSASFELAYLKSFSDSLTLTDSATLRLGHLLSLSDNIDNLNDSYAQTAPIILSFADSIANWQDSIELLSGNQLTFSDSFTLTDSIACGYGLGTSDALLLSDSATLQLALLLAVDDNADNLTDSSSLVLGQSLEFSDSTDNWLDQIDLELLGGIQASDSLTLSDSIQLRLEYRLQLSDQFTLADNCIVFKGVPNGLELSDDLNNWQDALTRRYRAILGDRVVHTPFVDRTLVSGVSERTVPVEQDLRSQAIPNLGTITVVPEDERTVRVPDEQRGMIIPDDEPVPPGDIIND